MKYITTVNDKEYEIEISGDNEIIVNGRSLAIDFQALSDLGLVSLLMENRSIEGIVEDKGDFWQVLAVGNLYTVTVQDERTYNLNKMRTGSTDLSGEATVNSPMPGIIINVPVQEGQTVNKGDKVVILESMKMENELRAPRDGMVARVQVEAGASVEKNQVLVVIVPPEDEE